MSGPRIAIVGLGVNGLCTAWALLRGGFAGELLLLDAFPAGHDRGASQGAERITRTHYETAAFAADARHVQAELWPRLAAEMGRQLVTPGPAVFWGPEAGPLPSYARAIVEAGGVVRELSPAEARRRFPSMRFPDTERVLLDEDAGVVHAAATLEAIEGWLASRGFTRRVVRVAGLYEEGKGVALSLADGAVERVDAVVLGVGPWLSRLVPAYRDRVVPVRQHVGFWPMEARAGSTPAWVFLEPTGLHYGLPTLAGGVMKAAFHRVSGEPDDPDVVEAASAAELDAVEARLRDWFTLPPGPRVRGETCWYANVADEQFILEPSPRSPRVLVLSACSGHAFKLAPLTGMRAAARLVELLAVGA